MKYIPILAVIATLVSCNNSGGGSVHFPPAITVSNKPIEFVIEYSLTGSGSEDLISKRYKNVLLTIAGKDKYQMSLQKERKGNGQWKCIVPPNTYKPGDKFDYSITCEFDGVPNSRLGKIVIE